MKKALTVRVHALITLMAMLALVIPCAAYADEAPSASSPSPASASAPSSANALVAGGIQPQADEAGSYGFRVSNGYAFLVSYSGDERIVSVPSSVKDNSGTSYTVIGIDGGTFYGKTNLTSVYIPNTVLEIASGSFFGCESLVSVTGASELQYIDAYAFYGCTNLASFPFGLKLQLIEANAFYSTKVGVGSYPTYLDDDGTGEYRRITARLYLKGKENYKYAYKVLTKVNSERKKRGLAALTMDKDLMKAAMQRAAEAALVFSHTRPNGAQCFTACSDKMSGENIAAGQKSAASVMKGWMNSAGHKANILNKDFKSIGVGCFVIDGRYCWVQTFGYGSATKASKPKNKTVTHAVIYDDSIGKLKFKIKTSKVKKGKKAALKIACTNSSLCVTIQPKSFKFTSANPKIATVDSTGKVKGKKRGKAKITATVKRGTLTVSRAINVK